MKKSIFLLVMLCACLLFMVACGADEPATNEPAADAGDAGETATTEPFEVKFSLQDPEEAGTMQGPLEGIRLAEENSNGMIDITVYAAGVLGDYITLYEDLQKGALDVAAMSLAEQFNDLFTVMLLPYAVADYDQAAVLYNPEGGYLFDIFAQGCEESGTILISNGLCGFLGVSSTGFSDEVKADLLTPGVKHEGAIIRVPMMDVYVQMGEALGFSVTTLAYADVYTSLQTGVVDGVIGTPCSIAWDNFRDVVNYWVDYRYCVEAVFIVCSQDFKDRMPADLWPIFEDAMHQGFEASIQFTKDQTDAALDKFINERDGVLVPTAEELEPMAQHVRDICWPHYAENVFAERGGQEFLDGILDAIDAAAQ